MTEIVETPTGEKITCRLYQQVNDPNNLVRFEDIPAERQPSKTYLNCILKGAEESKLPPDYIDDLKKIPHNNNEASEALLEQLALE